MTLLACLAAGLALFAPLAEARFLSVDPMAPDPHTGRAFNRYAYANNAPYTYIDPDGRVAIVVHREDGSVVVNFPTRFHGPAATDANIESIKGFIGGMSGVYEVNGARTPVRFSQASRSSGKILVPGSRYGTPFRRAMSYKTARVTMPSFMLSTEFRDAPCSRETLPFTG